MIKKIKKMNQHPIKKIKFQILKPFLMIKLTLKKLKLKKNRNIKKELESESEDKNKSGFNFKTKISKDQIIDSFAIDKNYYFDKYNIKYSWKDMKFEATVTKKNETINIAYLVCAKRGKIQKKCKGK
jgi:hypothetical protein